MAKWSARVQGMPKPNTPIMVRVGTLLVHGRLRRRHAKRIGWRWFSDSPWQGTVIVPEDEGITWCRGYYGPEVDRLAVVAALTHP